MEFLKKTPIRIKDLELYVELAALNTNLDLERQNNTVKVKGLPHNLTVRNFLLVIKNFGIQIKGHAIVSKKRRKDPRRGKKQELRVDFFSEEDKNKFWWIGDFRFESTIFRLSKFGKWEKEACVKLLEQNTHSCQKPERWGKQKQWFGNLWDFRHDTLNINHSNRSFDPYAFTARGRHRKAPFWAPHPEPQHNQFYKSRTDKSNILFNHYTTHNNPKTYSVYQGPLEWESTPEQNLQPTYYQQNAPPGDWFEGEIDEMPYSQQYRQYTENYPWNQNREINLKQYEKSCVCCLAVKISQRAGLDWGLKNYRFNQGKGSSYFGAFR